jgi:colanic acid/amylovoran biosynthesis glycosyltransferase
MSNVLILITSNFPFGNQENFLETEISYLSKKFSKIIILTHNTTSLKCRTLPNNVEIFRLRYIPTLLEKIWSLRYLFKKPFWKEIRLLQEQYQKKISFGVVKTLLISLENSYRLTKEYTVFIKNYSYYNLTLYSYWCNDSAIALGYIKLKWKGKIKCITRMHRWDIYFPESKYDYLPLRKHIFEHLDAVVSVSVDGINYLKEILKFNTIPFKLSRLGVLKQNIKVYKKKKEFLIVSCSNIIAVKRVALIAKALVNLRGFELKWVHFGSGPLMREIDEYCTANLDNNIKRVFKGKTNNNDILNYYLDKQPDLFINLSKSEGVPLSIMEAMSCSIPVLATNVGGTSEIVSNKNGVLLETNFNDKVVAKEIEKIYFQDEDTRDTLRAESFKTWRSLCNAEKNYNKFIDDYLT